MRDGGNGRLPMGAVVDVVQGMFALFSRVKVFFVATFRMSGTDVSMDEVHELGINVHM